MASIYELSAEFMTLWQLMEDGTLEDEALEGAFDVAKEDLADKLEGYCKFIKNLEATIAGLKAEEKRLADRRKAMENTVERSKLAMANAMRIAGEKKIPAGSFTCSLQQNPPKVVLDEPYIENIPEKYLVPQEPTINKKLILEDLKEGFAIPELEGVAHLETGESLRIR
jgi:hypothetical protein